MFFFKKKRYGESLGTYGSARSVTSEHSQKYIERVSLLKYRLISLSNQKGNSDQWTKF